MLEAARNIVAGEAVAMVTAAGDEDRIRGNVYALLGQAGNARRYAHQCLQASQGDSIPPFYLAYAYEALARAEMVAGEQEAMAGYLQQARLVAERMRDPEAKQMLIKDLETIK